MLIRPQIGAPTLTATLDGTHFINDRTGTSVNLRCISTPVCRDAPNISNRDAPTSTTPNR
jgi:hypothetical protein